MITAKPQIDLNYEHGRREHYEPYGLLLVQLQWTRLIAALALVAVLVSTGVAAKSWKQSAHQRIVVLTPSANGSLDSVAYVDAAAYQPGQKQIDYFALTFVRKYYSRIRYTIAQDYPDSLEFLDPALKQLKLADAKQTQWIENFQNGNDPEVRIVITKVRHEEWRQSPFHLAVDFEKHFYLNGREQPGSAENWTADLTYVLTPETEIGNDLMPVNPIGLSVGNISETKGFRQ